MSIGNVSLILVGGIINFLLVLWQMSTGMKWIKVNTSIHRRTGILLVLTSFLHGALAISANLL